MPTDIRLQNGSTLSLEIAPPSDRESFFVFGVHKGGSVMINKILGFINAELGIPEILIPMSAFKQGLPDAAFMNAPELDEVLFPTGYCYRTFRYFPPFLENFFTTPRRSIILVRDPRDILTSLYFSVTGSHSITGGEAGEVQMRGREQYQDKDIDTFALENIGFVRDEFASYEPLLASDRTRLYRYEDIIFTKAEWIADMLEFLGESLPEASIRRILDEVDSIPKRERVGRHRRKVIPGDHKEKLQQATIAKLDEAFRDVFARYGYAAG
ncbi:MAG: sulfotransferase domain-containing protein [Chthoniobacterales bacterium]